MDNDKQLGGGLANQMRALHYRVTPPSDPTNGTCWEVHPPSGDTVLLAKDEREGWEKASQHWHGQQAAHILTPTTPDTDTAGLVERLEDRADMVRALKCEISDGYQTWLEDAASALEQAATALRTITADNEALAKRLGELENHIKTTYDHGDCIGYKESTQ